MTIKVSNKVLALVFACMSVMNADGMMEDASLPQDALSQFDRGYLYEHGAQGIQKDLKKAFDEYSKSAAQGYAKAQCALGQMYLLGRYVSPDCNKAFEWYLKSAEGGYHLAQCYCGDMYHIGLGVEPNLQKAFYWLSKANDQGDMGARFRLAYMYEHGSEGVQKDLPKAIEMCLSAAAGNYGKAQTHLDHMRDDGTAEAQFHLGVAYRNRGRIEEAFELYLKSAKKGYVVAQRALGLALAGFGDSFEGSFAFIPHHLLDEAYATNWLAKGAEQGDVSCMAAVETGIGDTNEEIMEKERMMRRCGPRRSARKRCTSTSLWW